MEHVDALIAQRGIVHVEMEPGDCLYFHCNMLHRSDQNRSEHPRWSMICSYNAARNNPIRDHHHPRYTPLVKVPDRMIREYGERRFAGQESHDVFLDIEHDHSATGLEKSSTR